MQVKAPGPKLAIAWPIQARLGKPPSLNRTYRLVNVTEVIHQVESVFVVAERKCVEPEQCQARVFVVAWEK
jgi:hypothetical protein